MSFLDWTRTLTWHCDICRRERPDDRISVNKVDMTPAGFPAGTIVRNVKYCNDTPQCFNAALRWREDHPND